MTSTANESLWTASDVARYLKVSRSWVYQRSESGVLPHIQVGGLVRFVPSQIRAHFSIEGNQQKSAILPFKR